MVVLLEAASRTPTTGLDYLTVETFWHVIRVS
jgi:hypothetical protein